MDETITRSAGAVHGQEMTPARMESIIGSLGRVPRQRTTTYGTRSRRSGAAPLPRRGQALRVPSTWWPRHEPPRHADGRGSEAPAIGRRTPASTPRSCCRRGGSSRNPTRCSAAWCRIRRTWTPDAPDPANLWRVHWFNGADRKRRVPVPEHIVLPSELTGVNARDRRAARPPFPDDRRAQGARGLRVPGAAARHGPLRSGHRSRHLAVHRQLLPRRRRDLAHPRLPRRRRASRRHEPRTVRLARALGRRSGRHHPDAGHGEQRQGNLRQVRRALARPRERHPESVLGVRELPDSLPLHGPRDSIACSRT